MWYSFPKYACAAPAVLLLFPAAPIFSKLSSKVYKTMMYIYCRGTSTQTGLDPIPQPTRQQSAQDTKTTQRRVLRLGRSGFAPISSGNVSSVRPYPALIVRDSSPSRFPGPSIGAYFKLCCCRAYYRSSNQSPMPLFFFFPTSPPRRRPLSGRALSSRSSPPPPPPCPGGACAPPPASPRGRLLRHPGAECFRATGQGRVETNEGRGKRAE